MCVRVPTPLNVIPLLNLFSCPAQVLYQCLCSKATSHRHVALFWPEMLAKGHMGSRVTCPLRLSLSPLPLPHSPARGCDAAGRLDGEDDGRPRVEKRGGSGPAVWCGVNCVLCSNLSFLICEVGFDTSCLQPYLEDKVRRFVFKGPVNACKQKVFNKYCEFAFNENSKPLYSCREDAWPLFTFPKGLITP